MPAFITIIERNNVCVLCLRPYNFLAGRNL
jgi:hypothetical protein